MHELLQPRKQVRLRQNCIKSNINASARQLQRMSRAREAASKEAGLIFRNEMEVGPGGRQIQIEDPDGNPIELFEPLQ